MLDDNFVYLAALISATGSTSYVVATVRGRTRPNRVTWFLWALAPLVAFFAQIDEGVGKQALMTLMVGLGPLAIFLASFVNRQAMWRLTSFDFVCGGLSLLGVALWWSSKEALMAIAFAILADALAAVPTVRKIWTNPETEHPALFLFGVVSAGLTLLTMDRWSFAEGGFALYILMLCLLLASLALRGSGSVQREPARVPVP